MLWEGGSGGLLAWLPAGLPAGLPAASLSVLGCWAGDVRLEEGGGLPLEQGSLLQRSLFFLQLEPMQAAGERPL